MCGYTDRAFQRIGRARMMVRNKRYHDQNVSNIQKRYLFRDRPHKPSRDRVIKLYTETQTSAIRVPSLATAKT
jgi:hypothetical protein